MQFLGGAGPRVGGNGRGGLTARSRMRHPADVVEYHNEAFAVVAGTGGDVLEDAVDAECVQGVAVLALVCLLVKTRTYPMTAINSIGDMHQTLKTLGESNPRVAPEQDIRTAHQAAGQSTAKPLVRARSSAAGSASVTCIPTACVPSAWGRRKVGAGLPLSWRRGSAGEQSWVSSSM